MCVLGVNFAIVTCIGGGIFLFIFHKSFYTIRTVVQARELEMVKLQAGRSLLFNQWLSMVFHSCSKQQSEYSELNYWLQGRPLDSWVKQKKLASALYFIAFIHCAW